MANTREIVLAVFLVGLISISGRISTVSAQCKGDLTGLIAQCPRYVDKNGPKIEPSKECCEVVMTADVSCVCKYITKEIEQLISMEKVVFVAKSCGKPLAAGTKCGSFTVP